MKILVCGTPGTGKTSLSLFLSHKGFNYLNFNTFAFYSKAILGYDYTRSSFIINSRKIYRKMSSFFKLFDNFIVDSHILDGLPKDFDVVIVLRCNPEVIKKRLSRKYEKKKVKENLEAEILGIISDECKRKFNRVHEIDTSSFIKAKKYMDEIIKNPNTKKFSKHYDWPSIYEKQRELEMLFRLVNS